MRVYEEGAVNLALKLTVLDCANCGVVFGVTDDFNNRRRDDGQGFHCPNGHSNVYDDTKEKRLRKALEEEQRNTARLIAEVDQAWARVGEEISARKAAEREKRRIERRVHNGVCPYCHRTFQQLSRHMLSQHPDGEGAAAVAVHTGLCRECGRQFAPGRGLARHLAWHRTGH